MAISAGRSSVSLEDILSKVTEADILSFYLDIHKIPCIINSPLRQDKNPSFGFYSPDGNRIFYTDYSTREKGGIIDLFMQLWGMSYKDCLDKIYNDISKFKSNNNSTNKHCFVTNHSTYNEETDLQCKVRQWKDYDIKYWESYGISLKWLKYAEVYPISHKIIIKNGHKHIFSADKYAYAYVEHKEGKVTLKIYQPYNTLGYKWSNKHDSSVVSLWTKVPNNGDKICICSSLKDALCLWSNTGIPSIAVQGEGYSISNTAINELKKRYNKVYILFDNDEAGLINGEKLAQHTGFINLVLPKLEDLGNPKDISDIYFSLQDQNKFKEIILKLFK